MFVLYTLISDDNNPGVCRKAVRDKYTDSVRRMRLNGHSKGTSRTYKQGIVSYKNFLRSVDLLYGEIKISHKLLIWYIAYLTEEMRLSYNTIHVYIYALRDWALENGYNDPTAVRGSKRHKYNKFLAGVKRVTRMRKRNRLPLKRRELRLILQAISRSAFMVSEKVMLKAVFLIAFYGFLRVSEYTLTNNNSDSHLRLRDVKFIRDGSGPDITRAKLRLRRSKSEQYQCVFIDIFATNSEFCPVSALQHYVNMQQRNHNHTKNEPLFWSLSRPLSACRFNYLFKLLLSSAGLNCKKYSSHSLRSGGATVAADAGVPAWVIQRLGRWRSDCFKIYIKNTKNCIRKAQQALDI